MTTYEPAPDQAVRLMREIIREHRTDLDNHAVNIRLLFATSGKPGVPALKHRGMIVAGSCKVHGYEDRVKGTADATITIDGDNWGRWSGKRQRALLHHELEHIDVCSGKLDALDRPKLSSRHGDWEFDGFHHVLKLYGSDSFEWTNLAAISQVHAQMDLPFMADESEEESTVSFRGRASAGAPRKAAAEA